MNSPGDLNTVGIFYDHDGTSVAIHILPVVQYYIWKVLMSVQCSGVIEFMEFKKWLFLN